MFTVPSYAQVPSKTVNRT